MRSKSVLEWFIHPGLKKSSLTLSRATTIASTGIIAAAAAPFYAIFFYWLGHPMGAVVCLLMGLSIWVALVVLKIWGYINLSREIIISAVYVGVVWLSYSQGGVLTPTTHWLILPPIMAVFLGGVRLGIYWLLIITLTALQLFTLQYFNIPFPISPVMDVSLLMTVSIIGLAGVILALVYYFEMAKIQGFYELEKAAQVIKEKSYALTKSNYELKELATRNKAILAAAADGIIAVNGQGIIETYNQAIIELFEYNKEELIDKNLEILFSHPKTQQRTPSDYTFSLKNIVNTKNVLHELVGFRKDGYCFPLELTISQIETDELIYICVIRDITERKKVEERLAYLAHYDHLTNLPNRTTFDTLLNKALMRAKRSGKFCGLLYLDLDFFKNVNDTLGHDLGDLLLKEVANRINKSLRKGDTFSRLGGDEFTIILEDLMEVSDVTKVAQNILNVLTPSFILNGYEIFTGASIGIAMYPANGQDSSTLTKHADIAMYMAKERGRRNYQFFNEELNSQVIFRIELENHLHHALQLNELTVCYQPQVDVKSGLVIGIEALVRWQNASLGIVNPEIFIPIAEKIGLISPIGEWVLKTACQQFSEWQSAHLLKNITKMGLNISSVQLKQENLIVLIKQILNDNQLSPEYIELELTETAIMQDQKNAIHVLDQLNELGLSIAIDDFGTGYSSLSHLKCLPVHTLKIDKSFIEDLVQDKNDAMIIKAIIALGHGLELNVLAEGVETAEQFAYLQQNGCDQIQGFYVSPPLTAESMTHFLIDNCKK